MSETESGDRLVEEDLRAGLFNYRIGNQIIVVEETHSTNDLVWEMMAHGVAEGLVVFAERQTGGRGQYGRRWESAAHKGLWFSVLLRPGIALSESPRLTSMLAEVLAQAIRRETGLDPAIKPPNDIYLAGRKVAGILVEGRTAPDGSYIAVAGVGVNVNHGADDFPHELRETAGSLTMTTQRAIPRTAFAIALLRELNSHYDRFTNEL
jgi:BirA family biotin operon repressor/biotin-[acetyl-CoA-carboxylase] ligase